MPTQSTITTTTTTRVADKSLGRPGRKEATATEDFLSFIYPIYNHKWRNISTIYIQVSQEECARHREDVPYVKVYRYNPKNLCQKYNGYGDNGQRKVWSSGGSTHCTCQLTTLSMSVLECGVILRQISSRSL